MVPDSMSEKLQSVEGPSLLSTKRHPGLGVLSSLAANKGTPQVHKGCLFGCGR